MKDLTMLRKLANGEEPYGGGPFDADHVKIFQSDARELVAELERLREIVRHMSEPDAEMAREFVELRAMKQRAQDVASGAVTPPGSRTEGTVVLKRAAARFILDGPKPTYTCMRCGRSAPWTDGQSREAGDPVDEFWCQTCGHEQPLPQPDAPAV